jgi:hypothetical protein
LLLLLLPASGCLGEGLSEVIDLRAGRLILSHGCRTKTGRGAEPGTAVQ